MAKKIHVKKDDQVVVISGKDKGKTGNIEREGSIDASNVMLIDPKTGEATRIGYKVNEDGSKDRIAKKSGTVLNTVKKAKGE